MRKIITAATAALALIAGQAVAAGNSVVDRVGTPIAAVKQDDRKVPGILIALAAGVVLMVVLNGSRGDDSESD